MVFNDPKAFESPKEFSYYIATNEEFMIGKGRFSTLKIHTTYSPSKAVILNIFGDVDFFGKPPKRSSVIHKI